MAKSNEIPIVAKIVLVGNGNGGTISEIITPQGNNVSKGAYALLSNNISMGFKGLYLSSENDLLSKLDSTCYFFPENGYDGWVGNVVSKSVEINGQKVNKFYYPDTNTEADLTFTIKGSNITFLLINFDVVSQEWATKLEINGEVRTNVAGLYTEVFSTPQTEVTLKILEWNKPNCLPKITRINTELTLYYSRKQISSLYCSNMMKANERDISYGIVSQYGQFEIMDNSEDLLDLSYFGLLKENLPVQIYLNGSIYGNYLTGEWEYDYSSNKASVELVDEVLNWDNIIFQAPTKLVVNNNIPTHTGEVSLKGTTRLGALKLLFNAVGKVFNQDWYIYDSETETVLNKSELLNSSTYFQSYYWIDFYSGKKTVRELINQICESLQLVIYREVNSQKYVVRLAKGMSENEFTRLIIPATKTYYNKPLSCSLVNKNKKDKVAIYYTPKNTESFSGFTLSWEGLTQSATPPATPVGMTAYTNISNDDSRQSVKYVFNFSIKDSEGRLAAWQSNESEKIYIKVSGTFAYRTNANNWVEKSISRVFTRGYDAWIDAYSPITSETVKALGQYDMQRPIIHFNKCTPYQWEGQIGIFSHYTDYFNIEAVAPLGWSKTSIEIGVPVISQNTSYIEEIGDGSNIFTYSTNDFTLSNSTYTSGVPDEAYHIAENILNEYQNGKQSIYGDVIFGDYKLSDGTTSHNHIFKAGDIVEPYTVSLKPYGRNKDKTPKRFILDTVELHYEDGNVYWHIRGEELVKL